MELYYRRKRIADLILILSLIGMGAFLLAGRLLEGSGIPPLGRRLLSVGEFLAEATLIASIADYIAVTAITKQILWFKSTGLVPKKRKEIISSVVKAIEDSLFTREFILQELGKQDFKGRLLEYLRQEEFETMVEGFIQKGADRMFQDREKLAQFLEEPVRDFLRKADIRKLRELLASDKLLEEADPLILKLCSGAERSVQGEGFQELVERTLQEAVEKQKEASALNRVLFFLGEKTNIMNTEELAREVIDSILAELELFRSRESFRERQELAERLVASLLKGFEGRKLAADFIKLKNEEIDRLDIGGLLSGVIEKTAPMLKERAEGIVTKELVQGLVAYVEENGDFIDRELKGFFTRLIGAEYGSILMLTEEMLNTLSDENLIHKVNEVAGGDLQWLRISGSIIGLAAGGFCYIIMEFPRFSVPICLALMLILKLSRKTRKLLVYYRY